MAARPKQDSELFIPPTGIMSETFLTAGNRVIDKAGGPILVVVGFTQYDDTITPLGVIKYKQQIFLKVYINLLRKTKSSLYPQSDSTSIRSYHFFKDIPDDWSMLAESSDTLYLVCKYWSQKEEAFIYILKSIIEVETVNQKN